jgi:hypothetical protein
MTTVYVIRRTDKEDPTDTSLIFGAPGNMDVGYPVDKVFITSDFRTADEYQKEMSSVHGDTYAIEEREVQV